LLQAKIATKSKRVNAGGIMRHRRGFWFWLFVLGAIGSLGAQQNAEKSAAEGQFLGTWSGTWEAAAGGSGGIELTLEKGKDGALSGAVAVTEEPTYRATFKSLSFDGKKMTATYDYPDDNRMEVMVAAAFEADKASGTWAARDKANATEVASGTWTVTRK
jgi:hypothetical protein